jgi:hypothetical protein
MRAPRKADVNTLEEPARSAPNQRAGKAKCQKMPQKEAQLPVGRRHYDAAE